MELYKGQTKIKKSRACLPSHLKKKKKPCPIKQLEAITQKII
jgi:hypothetical protein